MDKGIGGFTMPIYTIDTLTTKYSTLGEQDNIGMNEYAPAIRANEIQEEAQACTVIIRPGFMNICDHDACEAATLNHVLYWIAQKVKQGADSWYATGEHLWQSMSKAWGITTIRKAIKKLVESLHFIGRQRNPNGRGDQTRFYFFGQEQAIALITACKNAGVCLLHMGLHADIIHLIKLSFGSQPFDKSVKCLCQNSPDHLINLSNADDKSVNSFDKSIKSTDTKNTTKITDKEDISLTLVSDALPPYEDGYQGKRIPLPELDIDAEDYGTYLDISTRYAHVDTMSHSHIVQATGNEAAPPLEQPHLITTKAALQAVSATSDGDLDQSTSPPTRETKAKGKRKKVMEAQPAGPPQKPPDDMAWSTRKCLAWFTYWRGKPLIGTYKNSQASMCAKGLAENYTEAEVIGARNDMELDAYYVTRGGADICDVANNIHKYLKRRAASSKTQGGYIINGKHYKQLPYDYCEWQGKIMLKEQANDLGWNGGFERYK